MASHDSLWTFDYYTSELGAAAAALNDLLADGEVTTQQVWSLVERFPAARQPAAYTFLTGLKSQTALRKYAMQIEAEREQRSHMEDLTRAQQERADAKGRELRTFWVGVVLLILPTLVSVLIPTLNQTATNSIRICSAAGLALLIAYVPGFFTLDSSVDTQGVKLAFRTAGGMAGLAMVYFFDPGTMSQILRSLFH